VKGCASELVAKSPHPPFGHLTPIRKGEREKADGEAPNLMIMPSLRLPLGKWEKVPEGRMRASYRGFRIRLILSRHSGQ
jgi:hypothetical protein